MSIGLKLNSIYCGDCAEILQTFPENSVDLIYADPPFFTQKSYEIIWGDGYEKRAYEDRWKGGIQNFISWIEPKIVECHRVLKKTGSMYLHCDWHANAHLRILMDKIFGENNFRNEIIWHYHTGGVSKNYFGRKHDTIFFYTKSDKWIFNLIKEKRYYEKPFFSSTEGYQRDEHGRLFIMAHPDDVWEIPAVLNVSKERLGYPTQKPEALLERIIRTSSNEGDIVLDPFCGCGTAIAVAHKLGRKWIGIDISPTSCRLMVKRMQKIGVTIKEKDIIGYPRTIEELKAMTPFEFENWVNIKLRARKPRKDTGIDGYTIFENIPIQVKQQESVGRGVVDKFETAMERVNKTKGIIVAFSFTRDAYEEVARAKTQKNLDIKLQKVEELIDT